MKRQLNALKDLSPPRNNLGYAFIYDDNPPTAKAANGYEKKILQQISKRKSKIMYPSPSK